MNRLYTVLGILLSAFFLVSFSTDPPNGKTGAPGDSFCTECHVQPIDTINGTITLEGFPSVITPNQAYLLSVVNRDTIGGAVRGGFQMTILGPTNTKAGTMQSPSSSSAVQILSGRQYFEHHPAVTYPDSNVIRWTVEWIAPDLPSGSVVTYYLAGNIANGNFQNTGDRIKAAMGSGTIVVSANEDIISSTPVLYPNPGHDLLFVKTSESDHPDGTIIFYNSLGAMAGKTDIVKGAVQVPSLAPGVYWLELHVGSVYLFEKWIRL
jgi:hypothetical protein